MARPHPDGKGLVKTCMPYDIMIYKTALSRGVHLFVGSRGPSPRCARSWARDGFPEPCVKCSHAALSVSAALAGYGFTSVLCLVITSMHAQAARSMAPAVYTTIIRSFTSWLVTVSHLGSFNITQLALIQWSEDIAEICTSDTQERSV